MTTPYGRPCPPFLVMAHHRSGSNFVNDVLQVHPLLECINEPLSMHTSHFRQCDLAAWGAADYDPVFLHVSLMRQPLLRSYLLDLRLYLDQSNTRRIVGIKETVLFGKLGWLKAFLPELKVLMLQRDPRAVVASVLRTHLLSFWNYAHLVPPVFRSFHPTYVADHDEADPDVRSAEVVAMSVAVRDAMAQATIGQFEHMALSLQDLMEAPALVLDAVAEFLGVAPDPGPVAFVRRRQAETRGGTFSSFRSRDDVEHGWRRHLSDEQVRVVQRVLHCP